MVKRSGNFQTNDNSKQESFKMRISAIVFLTVVSCSVSFYVPSKGMHYQKLMDSNAIWTGNDKAVSRKLDQKEQNSYQRRSGNSREERIIELEKGTFNYAFFKVRFF